MDRMIGRRDFVGALAGSLVVSSGIVKAAPVKSRIRAVAFDGFAIFDPTPTVRFAEAMYPERGRELVSAWRTRLFEYQWLRTLGGRYADFRRTAADALVAAERSLGLQMTPAEHATLLESQLTLVPWPDAAESVSALRAAGLRLAFLSNMTAQMLEDGAERAGFRPQFERILSTDRVMAAKPDRRAYQMAIDAFRLHRDQIAFVAFAGWDAAGASWFGYPTAWVNRTVASDEVLGATPFVVARELAPVVEVVTRSM
jgi:2-haloacid dehalogenase